MKVLFIGGNGNISWWCVSEALKKGYDVSVLNRQETLLTRREVQDGVTKIKADIRNIEETRAVLKNLEFDVVCDFIVRNETDAEAAFLLFRDKVKQYICISSESVYKREARFLPFKENTPLYNPDEMRSEYIKGKILAELAFRKYYETYNFPVTIVRPAYTYDTIIPASIGGNCWAAMKYAIDYKRVYIGGDGYALRTFTHASDFAKAFICLVGNTSAIGQDYHIATDEWLTWNEATDIIIKTFGIDEPRIIHLDPDYVLNSFFGKQFELSFQKIWHLIFDCRKIKSVAPNWSANMTLADGLTETRKWLEERSPHKRIDENLYKSICDLNIEGEIK